MLRLGFSREDLYEMPYTRAAWYVGAAAAGQDGGASEVRDATQADIDAF